MHSRDHSDEVVRRLRLGRTQERILAARLLGQRGGALDITALQRARDRELDHHVRRAIDQAIREAYDGSEVSSSPDDEVADRSVDQETYSVAFRSISKMLVHELRNVVGFARLDIAREVADLDDSKALRSVERIAELLDAIEELADIESRSNSEQLDLTELVSQIVNREKRRLSPGIDMLGPSMSIATGTPALIDLALAKGLENAAESTLSGPDPDSVIVVSWGVTDRDAWFAVIDEGIGVAPNVDVFALGKSNKDGHLGVGLTLASKSVRAMSGTLTLEANPNGGATLRASWPLKP